MPYVANKASNLIFVGFMGTGKTTVGKRVAQSLDFEFVDTDALIVEREGKSIQEIFEEVGEDAFREIETSILRDCIQSRGNVISTGGGIVTREANFPLMKQGGYVIWLKASPEVIYERVRRSHERPLLKTPDPQQTIRDMLESRQELYSRCADLTISTDDLSLEETIYGVTETARFWMTEGRLG